GLAAVFPRPPAGVYTLFPTLALSAFTNAVFLTSLLPILFLLKNLKEGLGPSEIPKALLGYRRRATDMRPYEVVLEDGGRLKAFYDVRGARLGERPDTGGTVWVTPAIPFLVPLTLGFFIALLWGDVISYIILRG
ncbi:MAG: A24 family peptidase C-terminal domain-containing protein, partial [Candidatus Hydrothermarchaeota archaeon]